MCIKSQIFHCNNVYLENIVNATKSALFFEKSWSNFDAQVVDYAKSFLAEYGYNNPSPVNFGYLEISHVMCALPGLMQSFESIRESIYDVLYGLYIDADHGKDFSIDEQKLYDEILTFFPESVIEDYNK
jgi:hypothetical protein